MDLRLFYSLTFFMAMVSAQPHISEPVITITDACSQTFYPDVDHEITVTAVITNTGDENLAAGDNLEGSFWVYPDNTAEGDEYDNYLQLEDSVWTLTSGSLSAGLDVVSHARPRNLRAARAAKPPAASIRRLDAGRSMTLVGTTTVRIPKDKCEDLEKLCLGLVMSDAAKAAASFTIGNVNDTATGDCQDFIVEGTTCDATVNAGELDCDGDGSGASKAYVSFSTLMISMYVVLKKLL